MLRFARLYALALPAILFAADPAVADGDSIVIQTQTNEVAGVTFNNIRTVLTHRPFGTLVAETNHAIGRSDTDYTVGVRTAEFELRENTNYTVTVILRFGTTTVGSSSRDYTTGPHGHPHGGLAGNPVRNYVMTIPVITSFEPVSNVPKVATLDTDTDSNGIPTPGDLLRYDVSFTTTHPFTTRSAYHDTLHPQTTLVPGSVTTSHGTVFEGNLPADTSVEVQFDPLPIGQSVAISYLARIDSTVFNQGRLVYGARRSGVSYEVLTDDPETEEFGDPTVVSIRCVQQEIVPPPPAPIEAQVFPSILPQYSPLVLTIEGVGFGTEFGPPTFSMQGVDVEADIDEAKDDIEVIHVGLTPAQLETVGVVPFTLTPADQQLPSIKGSISVRPAASTADQVVAELDEALRDHVGATVTRALEMLQEAQAQADADVEGLKQIRGELKSDLRRVAETAALGIAGLGDAALHQATAAGATTEQLNGIRSAVKYTKALQTKLVREVGKPFKKLARRRR